jgi:hypothetical protein
MAAPSTVDLGSVPVAIVGGGPVGLGLRIPTIYPPERVEKFAMFFLETYKDALTYSCQRRNGKSNRQRPVPTKLGLRANPESAQEPWQHESAISKIASTPRRCASGTAGTIVVRYATLNLSLRDISKEVDTPFKGQSIECRLARQLL